MEYIATFQSNVQTEMSTTNVPGHTVANTQQDEAPYVGSEEINTEGTIHAVL